MFSRSWLEGHFSRVNIKMSHGSTLSETNMSPVVWHPPKCEASWNIKQSINPQCHAGGDKRNWSTQNNFIPRLPKYKENHQPVLLFGRNNFSHVLNLGTKDFIDRMLSPLMRLRINIPWSEANFSWVALTGAQSAAATRTLSAAIYLLSQRSLSENPSWLFQRDLLSVLFSLGSWTGWREIAFDCGVFLPILSSF